MHIFSVRTHDAARHHTHAIAIQTQLKEFCPYVVVSSNGSAAYHLAIDSNSQIRRLSLNASDCFALGVRFGEKSSSTRISKFGIYVYRATLNYYNMTWTRDAFQFFLYMTKKKIHI